MYKNLDRRKDAHLPKKTQKYLKLVYTVWHGLF